MKNIVICGAGEVGRHATEVLAGLNYNITVIDTSQAKLKEIEETVDIRSLKGSACYPDILHEAGVANCDFLIAATDQDEINLLSAALAKKMGCKKVLARLHNRLYLDANILDYREAFGIDYLICPEKLTALEITSQIADPGVMEITHFADNNLEMHRYEVKDSSKVLDISLDKLELPKSIKLALIKRGHAYLMPEASTVLEEGDIVTLIGTPEGFSAVQSIFDKPMLNRKVAIMGGTPLGEWLVEDLRKRHFSIRLFEANRERAIELSEKYPDITVINTDPTRPNEFQAEQLDKCAAFIAVCEDDEHNILGALQAKQGGVPNTAAVIHSPTFLDLLTNLGIDLPFSPRIVAAKTLEKLVDDSPVIRLASIAKDVAEIYRVGPVGNGDGVGKQLKDIKLPKGAFVAAIQREDGVKVPGATDFIDSGDLAIVIGPPKIEKKLTKLFVKS